MAHAQEKQLTMLQQQKERQASWMHQQSLNKAYVRLDTSSFKTLPKDSTKTFKVFIDELTGLSGGAADTLKNLSLNNEAKKELQNIPPKDQQKQVQNFYSLFSKSKGFFGRSLSGQSKLLQDDGKFNDQDWAILHTNLDTAAQSNDCFIVVEFVLIIKQKVKSTIKANQQDHWAVWKQFGLGFSLIPLKANPKTEKVQIFNGTPRLLLSTPPEKLKICSTLMALFRLEELKEDFDKSLKNLVPTNFLIGSSTAIPGLMESKISFAQGVKTPPKLSHTKDLFCHKLSFIDFQRIENDFALYLDQLCKTQTKTQVQNVPTKYVIKERKIIVSQHNSLHQLSPSSSVNITQDPQTKEWQTTSTLRVPKYIFHEQVAMVFSLKYSVELTFQKQTQTRDFLIGYSIYMPALAMNKTDIVEVQVDQNLIMGPGKSIDGEMLWDQTQTQKSQNKGKINAILSFYLSSNESLTKEKDNNKVVGDEAAQQRIKELERQRDLEKQKTIAEQKKAKEAEEKLKKIEQEKLEKEQQLERERKETEERLKKEQEEKQKQEKLKDDKNIKKDPKDKPQEQPKPKEVVNKDESKFEVPVTSLTDEMRKLYIKENVEIEQLINEVMKGQKADTKLNRDSTQNLLKFLIQIIMSKETLPSSLQLSQDQRKQSLLTLLKSDPNLREELFGHLHEKSKEVGEISLVNPDQQRQYGYVAKPAPNINMDLEYNDQLKETNFTLKFQSVKLVGMKEGTQIPSKVRFVYTFYPAMFRAEETDQVDLENIGMATGKSEAALKKEGGTYWLTHQATKQKVTQNAQNIGDIARAKESALCRSYLISSNRSNDFARYLKEQELEISLYDDQNFLFGQGSLSLCRALRQGLQTRVYNAEVDLLDQDSHFIGTLLVEIKNEGLQSLTKDQQKDMEHQLKARSQLNVLPLRSKKVYSKPMQPEECDKLIQSTAMMYMPESRDLTEEARKKLRMDRLRQENARFQNNQVILSDPRAGELVKVQALKQIQLARELKKRQILSNE